MKTDSDDIDKQQLLRVLDAEYGLAAREVVFLPYGEDAFTYVAHAAGERYFVRVQPATAARKLERVYPVIDRLHHAELSEALAPIATHDRCFTVTLDDYVVAVFPFVEGVTLYRRQATLSDVLAAVSLIARLHRTPNVWHLPREQFDNPFEQAIRRALDVKAGGNMSMLQLEAVRLLADARDDIVATLAHMDRLGRSSRHLADDWVLSHGDPNLDNFLEDRHATLHLTDWGELAVGPPERDLGFFGGDTFEPALRRYIELRPLRMLHRDVFAFYAYRWSMQEIADYATRLLFHDRGAVEQEHAWAELQDYLPLRHGAIADGIAATHLVIDAVLGER